MTQSDVADVSRVERRCFSNPWPTSAYRRELRNPLQNYYVVLRAYPTSDTPPPAPIHGANGAGQSRNGDGPRTSRRLHLLPFVRRPAPGPDEPHVAGFAGMWILYDEAHITTIGVDPVYRGQRLGELLLVVLIEEAISRGATWLTLEVRVSNEVAQRLYRKYGFGVQGTRHRYYSDNGEDAHIMWSRSLKDPTYLDLIDELRAILYDRLGSTLLTTPADGRDQWLDQRLSGAGS